MRLFKHALRGTVLSLSLSALLLTSGCSAFGVYKIDLPQGTPLVQAQAQKVQLGMSKAQVVYLIGSPAVRDTLAPNRWDYIYDYTPGTYGKREGLQKVQDASQHLIIYFDDAGLVKAIAGVETLPTKAI